MKTQDQRRHETQRVIQNRLQWFSTFRKPPEQAHRFHKSRPFAGVPHWNWRLVEKYKTDFTVELVWNEETAVEEYWDSVDADLYWPPGYEASVEDMSDEDYQSFLRAGSGCITLKEMGLSISQPLLISREYTEDKSRSDYDLRRN